MVLPFGKKVLGPDLIDKSSLSAFHLKRFHCVPLKFIFRTWTENPGKPYPQSVPQEETSDILLKRYNNCFVQTRAIGFAHGRSNCFQQLTKCLRLCSPTYGCSARTGEDMKGITDDVEDRPPGGGENIPHITCYRSLFFFFSIIAHPEKGY